MRIMENKKGQFIIIAVMVIAIMMISLSVTMYGASTYYKAEKWEEYITLIDHVKLNTIRVVESSLANYTSNPGNTSILEANLRSWQNDLRIAYPGQGVALTYQLTNGPYEVQGISVNYSKGLAITWNQPTSLSAANVTFTLSFSSIGLEGYRFEATPSLNLKILNATSNQVFVVVKEETGMPTRSLEKEDFTVAGAEVVGVTSHYDRTDTLVYKILCDRNVPTPPVVTVFDLRGIKACGAL